MMVKKVVNVEKGKKESLAPTIKDVISGSQSWVKLALFLAGIPLSIIVLIIYALSFIVPMSVSIPLGVTIGLFLIVLYMDKLMRLLE